MTDWQRMCRGEAGFSFEESAIVVLLAEERRHRVEIEDLGDAYQLRGIVVRRSVVDALQECVLRAWRRNRATQLMGFRLDHRGRLIGEAWVPKAGLKRDELVMYVRAVAAECDRFEYVLTGKDRE